jgi:hypothetical protein
MLAIVCAIAIILGILGLATAVVSKLVLAITLLAVGIVILVLERPWLRR